MFFCLFFTLLSLKSKNVLFTFLLFYILSFVLTNIIFFHTFTPSNREEKGVRGSPSCLTLCNHILKIKQITL